MKIRCNFVSNSSSTSFIMTNISGEKKDLVDFVKETPYLLERFNQEYYEKYSQEDLLLSAKENNIFFNPHEQIEVVFGDEQGTIIGNVYDYILRDGVDSPSFRVIFSEYLR